MQEKNRKILLICLEVISLAILLPKFFWGTVKSLLGPIEDSGLNNILPIWIVCVFILFFNAVWITLMKLCPRDKIHVKVILTLLVLTFSVAILFCFIYLEGAF
jgi:hypothetical protein